MPRGSELSEGEREQIRAMHTAGISNRRIAEQLCRSSRTIDRFVQVPEAWQEEAVYKTEEAITVGVTSHRTVRFERHILHQPSSNDSIDSCVRDDGLKINKTEQQHRIVVSGRSRLTDAHKAARLQFASKNQNL